MDEVTSNSGSHGNEEELARCRRTMEALRATSAYNRSLFEACPCSLLTINTKGIITDVNGAVETLMGFERQTLLGTDFANYFTVPEQVRGLSKQVRRQGPAGPRQLNVRHRDGHVLPTLCDMVPLKDELGQGIGILLAMWQWKQGEVAEEAQKKRRDETLLDAAGAGIYSVDLQGHCNFLNPAVQRLLGFGAEELLGRSPHDTFHRTRPDGSDYPKAECRLHGTHDTGAVFRGTDEYFLRKDGSMFPVEYVRMPILENGWMNGAVVTFWDITERKLIEASLEESEAKFRAIYETNAIPLAFWRADGRIIEANDAYLDLIGYSRAELNDGLIDWSALTPPEYHHLDERALEQSISTPIEKEYVRHDGRRIPVLVGRTKFPAKEGGVVFAIDLTARKRMEEAVRLASAYNRTLIEANPDPVFVTDPNGRITDVNAAAESATERGRRGLIGGQIAELFTDPAHAQGLYRRTLREGTVRDQELALRHPGGPLPVLYNATVYRDEAGKVVGIFASARDISARKQTEEELRRREREFEALAEGSPDIVARVNAQMRMSYVNRAVERVTGRPREWFLGKTQGELDLPAEEAAQREQGLKYVFESGREKVREYRHLTPEGERYFQARLVPQFGPDGRVESVLVVERDITDLKRAQQALEELTLRDPLTGVANRRYLERFVGREWRREARHRHCFALIMTDIDQFKAYNDRYGHAQGDECLRRVAAAMGQSLHRPDDTLVRYGGEEFAVLLPETDLAAARAVGERLRQAVEAMNLPHAASSVANRVTVSIGVAAIKAHQGEFRDLFVAADSALYRAKQHGRNRVETSR